LKPYWQWPVNREPDVRLSRSTLRLAPAVEHAQESLGAVLGIQTTAGQYMATTRVETGSLAPGVQAGLSAFGDGANALGLSAGDGKLTLWRRRKNQQETNATAPLPPGRWLQFRMKASEGHKFRFSVSTDGRNWQDVGGPIDVEGDYLPPWDRGVRVALFVGGAPNASANFDWLRME
jgi:hypothetical protein